MNILNLSFPYVNSSLRSSSCFVSFKTRLGIERTFEKLALSQARYSLGNKNIYVIKKFHTHNCYISQQYIKVLISNRNLMSEKLIKNGSLNA